MRPSQEEADSVNDEGSSPNFATPEDLRLSPIEVQALQQSLLDFVASHVVHHRPIAIVTSGGTACDLEVRSVRCLENFSTGLRGAVAVEGFLRRGYAVLHLWREGSAAPFGRILSQELGVRQPNHPINVDALGRLLLVDGDSLDEGEELVQAVLRDEAARQQQLRQHRDPFLTEPHEDVDSVGTGTAPATTRRLRPERGDVVLTRRVVHSAGLQKALRERASALRDQRLHTVPFRTVEEYLAKLQLIACAVEDAGPLATFFLAAAVSDFYVPRNQRSEHKIQSTNEGNAPTRRGDNGMGNGSGNAAGGGLTLHLQPVPKALGYLRTHWAPRAFVVSFKLETDLTLLRTKAERAVERYGSHLVVGNVLETRHDAVWILAPDDHRQLVPHDAALWSMVEVSRSGPRSQSQSHNGGTTGTPSSGDDSLESALLDRVVQSHFEYVSWHHAPSKDGPGLRAAIRAQQALEETERRKSREALWHQVRTTGMELIAGIGAALLTYAINAALQRRLRGGA